MKFYINLNFFKTNYYIIYVIYFKRVKSIHDIVEL